MISQKQTTSYLPPPPPPTPPQALPDCICCLQVSATGADAFSRRKTQSKVYWSTIPKNKRDELQAAAAAAGTTVQINEDGTAVVQTAATGALLWLLRMLTVVFTTSVCRPIL